MIKIFKFFRKSLDLVLGFTAGPALFAAILYSVEHFESASIAIAAILAVIVLSFLSLPADTPDDKQKRKEFVDTVIHLLMAFVIFATVHNLVKHGLVY